MIWHGPSPKALRSASFVHCGLGLMGCTVALQVVGTAMVHLGRRHRAGLSADARGVAVLEFALVFPIALTIVLIMVQTALLMTGNLLVNYAAYCAARSAVVWIPRELPDEPRNVVVADDDASDKFRRIRRAAVLAVMPAATSVPADPDREADGTWRRRLGQLLGERGPSARWLDGWPMATALWYADGHTDVVLKDPAGHVPNDADDGRLDGAFDNGSFVTPYHKREDITVTVRHQLYLWVPYAGRIFGRELADWPGHYATRVSASHTLVNQGRYDNVIQEYVPDSYELLLPSR